jgi:hypothetical protein
MFLGMNSHSYIFFAMWKWMLRIDGRSRLREFNLLKSSGFFTYHQVLTFKNSTWYSLCVECFVRISEQTAAFAVYIINWLVFLNRGGKCLQRGTDWFLIYSRLRLVFKRLNYGFDHQFCLFTKKYRITIFYLFQAIRTYRLRYFCRLFAYRF